MSTICHKDYSITVSSPLPTPVLYYKFESLDASGILDSADGYTIARTDIQSGVVPQWTGWTVVPGLLGNCYQTTLISGILGKINPSPFDLSGNKSITIRFWFKATYLDGFSYWEVNTPCFGCRMVGDGTHAQLKFRCYLQMVTTPVQFGDLAIPCTPNVWHRAVFQYDNLTGNLMMQLDNGTMNTQPITNPAPPFTNNNKAGQYFYILDEAPSNGTQYTYIDELAIWNNLLTTSQLLYDWNSGNGVTYPW